MKDPRNIYFLTLLYEFHNKAWTFLVFVILITVISCLVFRRGKVLIKDTSKSDWIFVVKSVRKSQFTAALLYSSYKMTSTMPCIINVFCYRLKNSFDGIFHFQEFGGNYHHACSCILYCLKWMKWLSNKVCLFLKSDEFFAGKLQFAKTASTYWSNEEKTQKQEERVAW